MRTLLLAPVRATRVEETGESELIDVVITIQAENDALARDGGGGKNASSDKP